MWVKTASLILLLILASLLIEDVVTPHCIPEENSIYQADSVSHHDSQHDHGGASDNHHVINHFGHCAFVLSSHTVMILPTASILNPAAHYSFVLKLSKPARLIRPPIS